MARLEGTIKFSGALGELVAYKLNGKWIVRRKTSLDKKRVKTDPAFKNARKASQEFGGASTISKFLRDRWRSILVKDKDSSVHHRLNSLIYQWIREGIGPKGEREFTWAAIATTFEGINLNRAEAPNHYLTQLPEIQRNGDQFNYNLATPLKIIPAGATHVQIAIHLLELPEFTFDGKKYSPETMGSPLITIASNEQPVNTPMQLQGTQTVVATGNYAYCLSLRFFQEVNNQRYPLKEHPFAWRRILA